MEAPAPLPTGALLEKLGSGVESSVLSAILNRMKNQKKILASKGMTGRLAWSLASKPVIAGSDGRTVELLRFLNDFFKQNSGLLFSDEKIVAFINENASKFHEVEKTCQV